MKKSKASESSVWLLVPLKVMVPPAAWNAVFPALFDQSPLTLKDLRALADRIPPVNETFLTSRLPLRPRRPAVPIGN